MLEVRREILAHFYYIGKRCRVEAGSEVTSDPVCVMSGTLCGKPQEGTSSRGAGSLCSRIDCIHHLRQPVLLLPKILIESEHRALNGI